MYTAAPAFSTMAAIKCAYDLLESDELIVVSCLLAHFVQMSKRYLAIC